ncbi:TolC family outer membrane protein [Saccharophagus degradans]|uniref:TolC family outer membrane protein n=1 Tax=Saccharophagus degradans TaxID=86304 RepID=UPI002477EB42|nr:TolC family outer membrane protein [Saccharophagus degradans]WGO97251.1 TolC family outer membrane protein [Saccharophagus degradans]
MNKRSLIVGLLWLGLVSGDIQALTLEEAVAYTLESNPEVLAALNEYKSREHEVTQAKAGYLPRVSVSAAVGQEQRKAPATGNESVELDRKELAIQARQTVFDGFATSAEVKRQRARVEAAEFELQAVSGNTALRAAEVYLNVLRHAELLDLARDSLWEHQNIYDQMKLRSETGVGSKADLDQIAARLALANANMIVAQNNFADAQSNYQRVIGLFPNLENMSKPAATEDLLRTREKAVQQALENHPTLKAAIADVTAAQAQYKGASSAQWPRLELEADKRWDENVGGIEGEDEDFVVSLRLSYDLFAGGANRARKKQTAVLISEAKDIRNNSRRQVIESMELSWNAYDALKAQKVFLEQHVEAAKATKTAYAKQFNIGRRTLLDLLNTENEVVDSKRALINADYDQLHAVYRIYNASGSMLAALGIALDS